MEKFKFGIELPAWMYINDVTIAISFLACLGSLLTSIWLMATGHNVHWLAPILFGLLTLVFSFQMQGYSNLKGTIKQNATSEENSHED